MRATERYMSPSQLEAELRIVFRRYPIIVGRESDLPEPGSFFTHDDSGNALLVTRDPAGSVRAMLNVCSHRGTRLVYEERGVASSFVCRYHAWTYDLEGRLARPGRVGLPPALEQFIDDRALTALPCATRHGFVWVLPMRSRAALDVADALGPLDVVLGALDLGSFVVIGRTSEVAPRNWKHILDEHLEDETGAPRPDRALVLPSSLLVMEEGGLAHVAVFPRAVEESVVTTTHLAPRSGVALPVLPGRLTPPSGDLFHAAVERMISATAAPRGARG